MAKSSLIAITLAIIILICVLSSCSQHTVYTESESRASESSTEVYTESLSATGTDDSNVEVINTLTTSTITERSTETPTDSSRSLSKEQTTRKNTEQTTQYTSDKKTEAVTLKPTTTAAPETTTKKPTTTQPSTAVQAIDIDSYINYATNYGKSIGLNYDVSARDCWDNPITITTTNGDAVKRDIKDRLNRYKNVEEFTDFCVWAEKNGDKYNLYIGYA